jgi:hypothetical protein
LAGRRAGNGQYAAVILVPDPQSVTGSPQPYQGMLVPVIVNSGGCTGTSSATLTKTASVYTANAFQAVTYTYVVKNTGTTTLTNVVVTDDNGTPGYTQDDFTVGTVATLAPSDSVTFKATVYLPIRLFAQIGGNAIWDTLIPQVPATPANSLLLTYLIDNDVTDNTYGTGASAEWKAVGGHKLSDLVGNYAEFEFRDAKGNVVSEFQADYLSASGKFPSGYGSAGFHGNMIYGGTKYIDYITSTLSENLNGNPMFYGDTVNSPVGADNWESTAGYKVPVDNGIFGFFGMGSATVETNYVGATTFGNVVTNPWFWWYCQKNFSYNPQVVTSRIVSTAYLCASVLNCCTVVHAKASVCVTLNGCPPPTCSQSYMHKCQHQDECRCPCANCQSGNHSKCTQHNCSDPRCGDQGCVQQRRSQPLH